MENELKKAILQLKNEMNSRFTLIEKSICEMRKESRKSGEFEKGKKRISSGTIYDIVSQEINKKGGNLNERK